MAQVPDLSYMNDEQLLAEFFLCKKKAQDLCEPLGELLRQFELARIMLDALVVECSKRNLDVNLGD
jgi:hypothetical protein